MKNERLGAILFQQDESFSQPVETGLSLQRSLSIPQRLGRVLVEYRLVDEARVTNALALQAGWPLFDGEWIVDEKALEDMGSVFFLEKQVFPLLISAGKAFVMADGDHRDVIDSLRARYGAEIRFFIASEVVLVKALSALTKQDPSILLAGETLLRDMAERLLQEAVLSQATDIHIEPSEKAVEVRLRVDGVLHFWRAFPRSELGRLVNVFFHRAEISAGDFLKVHDARFEYRNGSSIVDIRLSHIPSVNGPSLVLRLLDRARSRVALRDLGYAACHEEALALAREVPHGLVLLTGPTGCGKTTTLYAMLEEMRGVGTKVVTVEDPVEVRMPLVTQVQVDIQKGHDFSNVTRALLRHDPDVILIGEVRDDKTAREALRAAMTGHRVLSTIHTNDAPGAILRLKDLGLEYGQIANVLVCVAAQRLVRQLCPYCKKEMIVHRSKVSPTAGKYLRQEMARVCSPVGCSRCRGGFKGRTVVAEIFVIDDGSRFLIEQGLIHELVLKRKENKNMMSMRDDVRRLIEEGTVSLCEAVRVCG